MISFKFNWFLQILLFLICVTSSAAQYDTDVCMNQNPDCNQGHCQDGICICPVGWTGDYCEDCQGRFLLNNSSGTVQDGENDHFSDCLWLIQLDPVFYQSNTTLHLSFDDVIVVCNEDFLNVYDGDSIFSPLLATYNGVSRPSQHIMSDVIASSGKALLHFQSQSEITRGYSISYHYSDSPTELEPGEKPNLSSHLVGGWSTYLWSGLAAQGRGSTTMAINNGDVYVYGGFIFGGDEGHAQMLRFDNFSAYDVSSAFIPAPRFGHTMISRDDQLIVFGGLVIDSYKITNELWSFNTTTVEWTQILPPVADNSSSLPLVVAPSLFGHSSHLLHLSNGRDVMLVIFGFHPLWQFSNFLFEYDIVDNTWTRVETQGAFPHGSYGHASALDEVNNLVYVHGGVKVQSSYEDEVYVYDAENEFWSTLRPITTPRFLHSLVFINGSLLAYGGRSLQGSNEICPEVPFEKYDIATNTWNELPKSAPSSDSRYGHVAVGNDRTMFVYGGYDGTMHSDVLTYTLDPNLDSCGRNMDESDCSLSPFCGWINGTCIELRCPSLHHENFYDNCDYFCSLQRDCLDCLSTALQCCSCSYCPTCTQTCFYGNSNSSFSNISLCDSAETQSKYCGSFMNCDQCNVAGGCTWLSKLCLPGNSSSISCPSSCSQQNNCSVCLSVDGCRWCESTETCVDVVDVYYPYRTCTNWRVNGDCEDPCISHTSCDLCSKDVRCGWCATDIETGSGSCLSGSNHAPVNNMTCPSDHWFFIECPACQCNGHSTCDDGDNNCTNCRDQTVGETCESCEVGYYGNPVNGGNCSECECNGHSDDCDDDGECYCRVEGMEGNNCQSCSENYYGEPTNGTCFDLMFTQLRYYFTFSTRFSENITQMNFEVCPSGISDLIIEVVSTDLAETLIAQSFDIDISYNYTDSNNYSTPEKHYRSYFNKTYVQVLLKQSFFNFGGDPRCCLRIYLTFSTPFIFNIAVYASYPGIGILLAIFFTIFFLLLLCAVIAWKVHEIWTRRRRRVRREIELQVMAARPLATIDFEYEEKISDGVKEKHMITNETLSSGTASVASFLLLLPYGDGSSPSNEKCFALGTALITKQSKKTSRKGRKVGVENPVLDLENDLDRDNSLTV